MMRMTLTILAMLSVPALAVAANARHPYSNIDHRVDAGNDTGDARVEALNQAQLTGARITTGGSRRSRFVPGLATIYPQPAYPAPYPPAAAYPPPIYPWPAYPYPYPY